MLLLSPDFFAGLKAPVDFYILRHGQSEGNASKILQGRGEFSLSEEGRLQAAARGRALKAVLADKSRALFFSSPQGRAKETALIIAEEAGLGEPVFIDELLEMSLGIWTGKAWEDVKNDALWNDFQARSWDAIPGAESSADLYDRALRTWAALRDRVTESGHVEKVIAVTHGGLIQWLIKSTLQNRSWFPLFPISNCGQFRLSAKPHPSGKSASLYWEEINSPIPADKFPEKPLEPRGFPS